MVYLTESGAVNRAKRFDFVAWSLFYNGLLNWILRLFIYLELSEVSMEMSVNVSASISHVFYHNRKKPDPYRTFFLSIPCLSVCLSRPYFSQTIKVTTTSKLEILKKKKKLNTKIYKRIISVLYKNQTYGTMH